MSNYGPPPGGPYPGPPQEPWHGRQEPWQGGQAPQEQYGQPSDPWGGQDPWGGHPQSVPPETPSYGGYGAGTPSYGPNYGHTQQYDPHYRPYAEPSWQQPPPPPEPPRKRGLSPILALVAVLAVLVCGGGAAAVYFVGRDTDNPSLTQGSPSPSAPPSATQAPSPTPEAQSSADARFVKKGQCVKNVGTNDEPDLQITKCGSKTYEVLERIDAATTGKEDAEKKCAKVEGYTDWYFFDSPFDLNDYVLCLKLRS